MGVANDGSVVGTTVGLASRKVGNQPFEFWLKKKLGPKGHGVRLLKLEHEGHKVAMLEVEAAQTVAVRFDGIAYIRVGSALAHTALQALRASAGVAGFAGLFRGRR